MFHIPSYAHVGGLCLLTRANHHAGAHCPSHQDVPQGIPGAAALGIGIGISVGHSNGIGMYAYANLSW